VRPFGDRRDVLQLSAPVLAARARAAGLARLAQKLDEFRAQRSVPGHWEGNFQGILSQPDGVLYSPFILSCVKYFTEPGCSLRGMCSGESRLGSWLCENEI
jgi:hypothetical protein